MQSDRSKETLPLLKKAKGVVLLSGTPALSRPIELFTQLDALVPAAKIKYKEYGERYCQSQGGGYGGKYDKFAKFKGVMSATTMSL